MFDSLSNTLISFAISVINLFPESPFAYFSQMGVDSTLAQLLAFVNWFVPIYSFVGIFETWLICVGAYYAYQIVLRWIKVVG